MPGWVGLDVGTTSSKVVIYGDAGETLATGRRPTVWDVTPEGVEIQPQALIDGALGALADALDRTSSGVVMAGIGITSMGETGVLVNDHGEPVAPAIAWHDTRDDAEVALLRDEIGADVFCGTAGKPLRGQFSLTKHRWLVDHHAATAQAVRRFNVAEWVARALGADEACDRTLACRTGWFDLAADQWWDEALAWSGTSAAIMPPLVQPGQPIGRVSMAIAPARLIGAVVTLAGHDHQAAALGAGAGGLGDEFDSAGTAEALIRTVRPDLDHDQVLALAQHGITTDVSIQPGRWSLLGGTEGGLAMQRTLGALGIDRDGLADLDARALAAGPGTVRVAGIGGASLVIADIRDGTGPGDIWRAVVEGATAQAVELHRAMTDIAGPHRSLVAAGGWCHSAMVMHTKRLGFGDLTVSSAAEAGTLGAATLAARAAGGLGPDELFATSDSPTSESPTSESPTSESPTSEPPASDSRDSA